MDASVKLVITLYYHELYSSVLPVPKGTDVRIAAGRRYPLDVANVLEYVQSLRDAS